MTNEQIFKGTNYLLKLSGLGDLAQALTKPETYAPIMNANWNGPVYGAFAGAGLGAAKNLLSDKPLSLTNTLKDSVIGAGLGGAAGGFTNFDQSTYSNITDPIMRFAGGAGLGRVAGSILTPEDNKKQSRLASLGGSASVLSGLRN